MIYIFSFLQALFQKILDDSGIKSNLMIHSLIQKAKSIQR